MKNQLLLILMFCSCFLPGRAQQKIFVAGNAFTSANMQGHIEVATVKKGDNDIHQLLNNAYPVTFAPGKIQIFTPRKTDSAYWIRFSVLNNTSGDLWLFSPYSGFYQYNVYLANGDSVVSSFRNGALLPFNNRYVPVNVALFPLHIPPATERQVYIYIRYSYSPTYSLYLATPVTFTRYLHMSDLISGAYLGLFLLILFYNLIIYFYLRDRSNLIYSAWITASALAVFAYHGLSFEYLWPQMPAINSYIDVFTCIAVLLQIVLNFSLFRLRSTSRFFTLTSYIAAFLAVLCILSHLSGMDGAVYPLSDAGTVVLINGINTVALSVLMVRKGMKYALYYLLGNVVFFISMVLVVVSSFAVMQIKVVSQMTMVYFGSAGEILFFALALASKVRALKLDREKSERENFQLLREREQLVRRQKETLERLVTERTAELSRSLKELKETQAQLIQREKMASLGELTAGIAHEIQNPLNFVNNFSEVNEELIAEMQEEMKVGHTDMATDIAEDIKQNNERINNHGKRASSIIRSMLEHSRTVNETEKQLTSINALTNEYLQLAYHGVRVKHPSFTAAIHTDYDNSVNDVFIAPGEVGRALLNIYNNAFYSIMQKKDKYNEAYEPAIFVSTKQLKGKIEICIKDNGTGISPNIVDKVFNPFFTTKPAGQGTGLGLSLSHDIIVQGHHGELLVNSKEGDYAEFIIYLPV